MNATHAHAFKARAADKRQGFGYVVTLTNGPGMTLAQQVAEVKVKDLRAAKKLATERGLICHNY